MADGSSRRLVYSKEVSAGVPPTPNDMTEVRVVPGTGLTNARTAITSNEIRADRQIISSKLGNNAPDLTIPFELTYGSYDEFFEGALGNSWIGGFTSTINIDVSTGGVFTRNDGGSWIADGYTVGTYVTIQGLVVTAEDGAYEVTAVTIGDLTVQEIPASGAATFTAEVGGDIVFTAGAYGVEITASASDTIVILASAFTITLAGTLTWNTNVEVGDRIFFQDFVNGGNNGWKEVTTITSTVMTCINDTFVDETINTAVTVTYATATGLLTVGTDLPSFHIEEQFTDIPTFAFTTGSKIDTMNMSIQPEAIVTGDYAFQGVTYSGYSGVSIADSVINSNINTPFDSFTGFLEVDSIATCVVSGFDFSLANGLSREFALLVQDACRIGDGRSALTGTMSGYFTDSTVADLYDDETIFSGKIMLQDIDGNSLMFGFPRLKLNSYSNDIPENSITFSSGFDALGGDTLGRTNIFMHRTPMIA